MKLSNVSPTKFIVLLFVLFLSFSCSKDSDLLSDYVLSDSSNTLDGFVVDDFFMMNGQGPIVMDVLTNDGYSNQENVEIVGTSVPKNGTVIVNEDKTLTYIPGPSTGTPPADNTPPPADNTPPPADNTPPPPPPADNTPPPADNTPPPPPPADNTPPPPPPADNTPPPADNTEEVDSFTYTTETENEDGSVTTDEGTVTVNSAASQNSTTENNTAVTGPNVYYVTTSGTSSNDGKTEATARSIQHAFATAGAGDIIYIKAGDYVWDANLYPANNGSAGNPVKFIGYKITPGDIVSTDGATVTYADYLANGNDLDSSDMPLIRRSSVQLADDINRRGIELAGRSYIELENLQFKWQQSAVDGFQHGAGIKLKNIVTAWTGNFDPNDSWNGGGGVFDPPVPAQASGGLSGNMTGVGIALNGANGALIENCTIINSGHIGIISGTVSSYAQTQNTIIRGCKVYSDQNINPADYYIELYNARNSLIENSSVYRMGSLTHQGHGIDLKMGCTNNIIRNCYVENTWVELNGAASNNTFENITIKGISGYANTRRNGGIKIFGNSHDNFFTNIEILDADGVVFADVLDALRDPSNAGYNNTFDGLVVRNSQVNPFNGSNSPITFGGYSGLESFGFNNTAAYGNTFINCTFDTAASMFTVQRPNSGNEFINCNFRNIPLVYSTMSWGDSLDATFTNCNFENSAVPN